MDSDSTAVVSAESTEAPIASAPTGPVSTSAGPSPRPLLAFDTRSVARSAAVVLALVAVFLLALWLWGVIGHFVFLLLLAWLFAAAMEPGIAWFVRKGRKRGLAATLTGSAIVLVSLMLVAVFGDLFVQQAAELLKSLPNAIGSAADFANSTFHTHLNATAITQNLQVQPSQLAGLVQSFGGGAFGVLSSIASIALDLTTVLVFGFYMAAAGPRFLQTIARGLRPREQQIFVTVADITSQKTGGYVVSKVLLAGLSSLFHGILFAAIGVPYWLPFALLVGITAQFVPLVGTYIGVLLPVISVIATAPWKAIVIIIFAVIYQQIESYVFTPRVSKKTMDVNPAVALAAVFIGAAIWGPIGMLIGIPLVAAGVAVAETFSKRYELVPALATRVEASDPKAAEQIPDDH